MEGAGRPLGETVQSVCGRSTMSIYPERLNYYVDGGAVAKPQFSAVATLLSLVNGGVVPPIVNDLVWLSFALALNASEGGHTCIDQNRRQ